MVLQGFKCRFAGGDVDSDLIFGMVTLGTAVASLALGGVAIGTGASPVESCHLE